jgi:hypothetical protein
MSAHKLRSVDTHFWDDSYIVSLDPSEKLLFLYLLTNPLTNLAGVYEITVRRIVLDTGYNEETVLKILGRFERDEKVYYQNNYIMFINFQKRQRLNSKMLKNIEGIVESLPKDVKTKYLRLCEENPDTLYMPHAYPIYAPCISKKKEEGRRKKEEGKRKEIEDEEEIRKIWISVYKSNPGIVEIDFVTDLINSFDTKKAKQIVYDLYLNGFHKIKTMRDNLDWETGKIKSKNDYAELPKKLNKKEMKELLSGKSQQEIQEIQDRYFYNNPTEEYTLNERRN